MQPYTLLIIDPAENRLKLGQEFGNSFEYEVCISLSFSEALNLLKSKTVFSILVGWEDFKKCPETTKESIRQSTINPNIPILAIADQVAETELSNALDLGVTRLFIRPLATHALAFQLSQCWMQYFLEAGRLKNEHITDQLVTFYRSLDSLESQVICQRMQDFANHTLHVKWVSVWWFDKSENVLRLGIHSSPEFPVQSVRREEGHSMWAALEQEKYLIFESSILEDNHSYSKPQRTGLALVVPMIADGVWLGVINFTNFDPSFFQTYSLDDLVDMGLRVTSRLGHALNHEKVLEQEQELHQKHDQLEELNEELKQFLSIQETISTNLLETSHELSESKQHLEALSQMKDDFLAIASHDLRSPLSGIRVAIETILELFDIEEDVREMLVPVIGLCNDQLLLVTELLDIAKLESGKMDLDCEALSTETFFDLLKDQGQNLEMLARVKGIELILDVESDLPAVSLDVLKIKQVLHNLVGNAIKFTKDGGKIYIRAKHIDNCIQITVQDSGVGMRPEDLNRIFNKYEQVKDRKVGTKGERGSGLGLAICKNLIELHKGKLWAESELGEGSQFHFKIPCQQS